MTDTAPPDVSAGAGRRATVTTTVEVAGTGEDLWVERDALTGALVALRGGGRTYLEPGGTGAAVWGGGFATVTEHRSGPELTRTVATPLRGWTEGYRWDGEGRLVEVDGTVIRRDDLGRVVACLSPAGSWFYTWTAGHLTGIATPSARRSLAVDRSGRPVGVVQDGCSRTIAYDAAGRRTGVGPLPATWHRDAAGRLWSVTGPGGRVLRTFLWDGNRCLARIDGPPGEPLAAVFSLDPSGTPVRVVEAGGVVRVPRDAFGESLLSLAGVPGLFGGAVHGGVVHLALRGLDPATGAFCAPDPCDGGEADPRRRLGYQGDLPVEPEPASRYEICRGDPVGRADPTGGVSAGLIISDFTWSLQNNLLTFFGLDWWFNLFASLFSGFQAGNFGSSDGLSSSDRLGSFGIRRDGFVAWLTQDRSQPPPNGRAFTTQHLVWSDALDFDVLDNGEVIDPGGRLPLTHYGSVLLARPPTGPALVLASATVPTWVTTPPRSWSRAGGPAEAVARGTGVPWFPSGGLHLDTALTIRGPVPCPLSELHAGEVATGTLEDRAFLTTTAGPSGLRSGDLVAASDTGTSLALTTVVSVVPAGIGAGGLTAERVHVVDDLDGFAAIGITMAPLDPAPASSESLPAAPPPDSLDARATTATYAAGDLLRLTASGGEVSAVRVERLEAAVPLDRAVPSGFTPPLQVALATVAPAGTAVTVVAADRLGFPGGAAPAEGALGLVVAGADAVPVRVTGVAGDEVTIDATLPGGLVGGPAEFRAVTGSSPLGARDGGPEAAVRITYRPVAPAQAPDGSAGPPVVVRIDAGADVAVRRVTGAPVHDAVVLDRAPAGSGPWQVERLRPAAGRTPAGALALVRVVGLVVDRPDAVDGAPALLLARVIGTPPTPGTALVTGAAVAGTAVTASIAPGSMPAGPAPGDPVLVDADAAAVRAVRLDVTFDRVLPLPDGDGVLTLVGLDADGPTWQADWLSATEVVAAPRASLTAPGASPVDAAFPRFVPGDVVEVAAPVSSGTVERYRIAAVDGLHLTLGGGPPLADPGAFIGLRRMVSVDPGNGGPFLGRNGTRTGTDPSDRASFDVWAPDALPEDTVVGVVTPAGETHPATITDAAQDLTLTLSEAPGDRAAATVAPLQVAAAGYAAALSRDGEVLLLADAPPNVQTTAGQSLVVVAQRSNGVEAPGATLAPGTLLVPQDETTEVSRRQALVDHELTHTLQYAQWGPLWFNFFPMLVLELPGILATDTELPEYSGFLQGSLTAGTGQSWNLTIPDREGVSLGDGDTLQVLAGSRVARVTVVSVSGGDLVVRKEGEGAPPTGSVNVRKLQAVGGFDWPFNILQLFTHGGLLNILAGSTWGGIIWLLAKGVWGLGRLITGTGDFHPATVQAEGRELLLTDDAGRAAVTGGSRVIIRQSDASVVRTVTREGDVARLAEPVTMTGQVQVTTYRTRDPLGHFDWLSYYPATIVDLQNPAIIRLDPGEGELSLAPNDRVEIIHANFRNRRTTVTAVSGSDIELQDPIPVGAGGEPSLRIAKVFSRDPMGNADSAAMMEMGMGWMRWLFDPYGQIQYAANPSDQGWLWVLRVVRWLLGTEMWSLLPALGYVWWFRLLPIIPEHLTAIEQEASEESGDLYSPLGRLLGQRTDADAFATFDMVVGDVARYRFWRENRNATDVTTGGLDSAGLDGGQVGGTHLADDIRVIPHRLTTGGTGDPPNGAADADPAPPDPPGRTVAAALYRTHQDPTAASTNTNPVGFSLAPRGFVPRSPTMEKTLSGYVAFSRPGTHRVTTRNDITSAQQSADNHASEAQPLFYDLNVADVAVTVAGQAVAEGGSVDLVPFQRAEVRTLPDAGRTYRVTVRRPADGASIRLDGATTLVGGATATTTAEPVEVSRFYAFDAATGSYGAGGLARSGLHLGGDVHVAVRRFAVNLTTALPLRATPDPAGAALASLAVGDNGILLVPAPVVAPPVVTAFAGRAPLPTDPALAVDPLPAGEWPTAFLGAAGSALRLRFAAAASFTAGAPVVCTLGLGLPGSPPVPVTCSFTLTP